MINPLFSTDAYKLGHISQYNQATQVIFSNFTPRADRLFPHYSTEKVSGVIFAGLQGVIKDFLLNTWNDGFFKQPKDKVISQYKRMTDRVLGEGAIDMKHIEDLHDLGYLPLEIRAISEGKLVPIQVPVYTVHNTDERFAWLTNYLETALSAETWKVITNSTIAFQYHLLGAQYAKETCDGDSHLQFQFHDFSARGLSGIRDSYQSGFGHLTSFVGTDSILAIQYAEDFYSGEHFFTGCSVPASEHSVATTNIGYIVEEILSKDPSAADNGIDYLRYHAEKEFLRRYVSEIYPTGIVSYVSDSYDYWSLVTQILPELRETIMQREGKLVIRPDSGDPVKVISGYKIESFANWQNMQTSSVAVGTEVIYLEDRDKYYDITGERTINASIQECYEIPEHQAKGTIEVLWEVFGGKVNSKGFKELDSHIGLIYGDSITVARSKEIFERLKDKGFASSNVVLGVGSYTYNYSTRDSFGFACKATGSIIGDKEILVTKEPKTDMKKRSAKGFLKVVKDGDSLRLVDNLSFAEVQDPDNELKLVFHNGTIFNEQTIEDVRTNVKNEVNKYIESL